MRNTVRDWSGSKGQRYCCQEAVLSPGTPWCPANSPGLSWYWYQTSLCRAPGPAPGPERELPHEPAVPGMPAASWHKLLSPRCAARLWCWGSGSPGHRNVSGTPGLLSDGLSGLGSSAAVCASQLFASRSTEVLAWKGAVGCRQRVGSRTPAGACQPPSLVLLLHAQLRWLRGSDSSFVLKIWWFSLLFFILFLKLLLRFL